MKKLLVIMLIVLSLVLIVGCSSKPVKTEPELIETITLQCQTCDSSDQCPSKCDAYCVNQGYDGQRGSSGFEDKKYLGLKKDVTCTCKCWDF